MIQFKPDYERKDKMAYVLCALLSMLAIYIFIDSGYRDMKVLGFPLMMIVWLIIYTRNIIVKNIIFDDFIRIERFLWGDIIIQYDKIEHITFANLKAGRKTIQFNGIMNKEELLKILNEKINEGKINIDNAKNQKIASKQYINIKFGIVFFLLLAIIQGISSMLQHHIINSFIDGVAVWIIIYLIYKLILDRKFS